MTKPDFSVQEAVQRRYSVRTYDPTPLPQELREKLSSYAQTLTNPLGPSMRIQWIDRQTAAKGEKLGTYGIIRGATTYWASIMPEAPFALEALGYELEHLILYATSLGLGTCWLGGTFDRSAFAAQIEVKEGERFAILTPIGYPADKKRLSERVFRKTLKADARKPWRELFFAGGFGVPLTEQAVLDYRLPLEMLRLAPSAVNKQPWRVVFADGVFHFFYEHTLKAGDLDMQRIDAGIGICHFHLAALEQNLSGHFVRRLPTLDIPADTEYVVSWVAE